MAWATKYQGLNPYENLPGVGKGRGRPIKWVVVSHGTRGGTQLEKGHTHTSLSPRDSTRSFQVQALKQGTPQDAECSKQENEKAHSPKVHGLRRVYLHG